MEQLDQIIENVLLCRLQIQYIQTYEMKSYQVY